MVAMTKLRRIMPLGFLSLRFLFGRSTPAQHEPGEHPRHSPFWGAVLGISISIIPLYIVIFVSNGMIRGITDRYLETKSFHLQAILPFDTPLEKIRQLRGFAVHLPNVISASPEIDGLGLAASSGGSVSAQIRGLDRSIKEDQGYSHYVQVDSGVLLPQLQSEAVLGRYLAKALQVKLGDTVTLITLRGSNGDIIIPKMSVFKVVGIISTGYRELDANWFIISYAAALRILNSETSYSYLGIKVKNPYGEDLEISRAEIYKEMQNLNLSTDTHFAVRTWKTTEQGLFQSFSSTQSILIFIMALAVVVAAINLASALITFVLEHRLEIAILKSFGLSQSQVAAIFLVGGTATGAIGVLLGSAAGISISMYINQIITGLQAIIDFFIRIFAPSANPIPLLNPDYYLEHIPIQFNWTFTLIIMGISVIASVIVSVIPALKSAAISPSELIRHE